MDLQKLLENGEKCIHDEPPACAATCPIHVDVSALLDAVGAGNFQKAYQILEKRMPFPRLIGRICDHPCHCACVREKMDCALNISELERAAVEYGYAPPKKMLPIPKTLGKVAVVGGGISGMTAAVELDKKGAQVTVYEQSPRLGGRLWDFAGSRLDPEEIEEELLAFEKRGITVHCQQKIDSDGLSALLKQFDAVYLGTGTWEEGIGADPLTFQVRDSLFAGGRLVTQTVSVIGSVSTGKRAAVSIERFLKKVSMTAAREREGTFDTPLHFNLEDAMPEKRISCPPDGYGREAAAAEARRCLHCRCVQCVKCCSHMKSFKIAPKAYARQIGTNESVIMGTHYANKMINSCTLCGLCDEQCANDVHLRDMVYEARKSMVEKGKMPPSAHDFALRDMQFSNSSRFFMVKSPPEAGAAKEGKPAQYLFYPGCQLSASAPESVEASYRYLLTNVKEGVGLMLGCCGAPADWAGRQDLIRENVERLKRAWETMGRPTFILACSSCGQVFQNYLPEIPVISLWEIMDRYGLPDCAANGAGRALNIHDACTSRYNERLQSSIRKITRKLGYEIDELNYSREKTKCCGYGGLVYYANREQAENFIKDRIGESGEDLLVYCAMCKDLFVGGRKRTYHILDLLFAEDLERAGSRKMPNLSQRQQNRAELKRRLLRKLWGEELDVEQKHENLPGLVIPPEVWESMEKRYILLEEVKQVISHAQKTGERFFNPESACYSASLRIGEVTYWVRYREEDGSIQVVSVYSHRMEIAEE
ncbi:MAG: FAD-dependent oxidoreductase [Oscillibacter sp.]|nr:FAD-dependent oxidoreductase [Oscillibacter sp.]